jgi:hypothetical protein
MFMLKCLWSDEQGLCHRTQLLLEIRDGSLIETETEGALTPAAPTKAAGWGEPYDGPVVVLEREGVGRFLVPASQWRRVQAALDRRATP